MNINKTLTILSVSGLLFFTGCKDEPKQEEQQSISPVVITNNDIGQAKELFLQNPVIDTTWLFDSSNTGFGQKQDFNADSAAIKNTFPAEQNTDWYKFVASADTSLSVTIEPNDPLAEYDIIVFKSTGDSVESDLQKGLIPAIRSNFGRITKPSDTITGFYCDHRLPDHVGAGDSLAFAKAFWTQKGETYYVVVNTETEKGKGYKLRIQACAPGTGGAKGKSVADAGPSAPEITSFYPTKGRQGTNVLIKGNHFKETQAVRFGGTDAESFQVVSDKLIKARVGSGSSGTVTVNTPSGEAAKDAFSWLESSSKPGKKPVARKKSAPEDDGDYYIVKPKDTMFSIAFIFGMTVDEILKLNKLNDTNVFVGQKLKVIRRQLPQKKIEEKVKAAPKVVPSKPAPGSTTDPKIIAAPKQDPPKTDPVVPLTPNPVDPIQGKTSNFTPTPLFPKEDPRKTTNDVQATNSLAPADKNFWVYCNVTSGVNKQPVGGTLQVVDLKRKDLVYNVQANKTQKVPLFNAGGKQKLFICDIFGYKKQDFDLNLDNIINDSTAQQVQIVDDTIVINFELRRLEKGDVAVAYNIFFYDDASVMLPKSTYELDQLLELMKENNKIKIKIHGHTNTSKLGRILYLEKGDQTFFRLTGKNKETYGPARLLSKKRAETIKWYLESKKITDDRIQTEGHGGSQMLYPNTHPLAFKNKRVEVEILEDK
jgi:outer membrane protein OmpA-like peptidoglycan-associated protein/LysM repeat protein